MSTPSIFIIFPLSASHSKNVLKSSSFKRFLNALFSVIKLISCFDVYENDPNHNKLQNEQINEAKTGLNKGDCQLKKEVDN